MKQQPYQETAITTVRILLEGISLVDEMRLAQTIGAAVTLRVAAKQRFIKVFDNHNVIDREKPRTDERFIQFATLPLTYTESVTVVLDCCVTAKKYMSNYILTEEEKEQKQIDDQKEDIAARKKESIDKCIMVHTKGVQCIRCEYDGSGKGDSGTVHHVLPNGETSHAIGVECSICDGQTLNPS